MLVEIALAVLGPLDMKPGLLVTLRLLGEYVDGSALDDTIVLVKNFQGADFISLVIPVRFWPHGKVTLR
jgi:hypothetical protein